MKRAALTLFVLLALIGTPALAAAGRAHAATPIKRNQWVRRVCAHARRGRCHRHHHAKRKPSAPPVIEIGDVPGCRTGATPVSYLQRYRAVLRVIITPTNYQQGAVACARAAVAGGYRLHLVIQWSNPWTVKHSQRFFRSVLSQLGSLAWAISIGNEQELNQGGPALNSRHYAAVWRAVEPLVARMAPHAIRVAGEISPWGFQFLKAALVYGLPGVQAVSAHPYRMPGCFSLPEFAAWARSSQLPYWYDEGYLLPGAWLPTESRTASEVQGAAVVGAWLYWGHEHDHPAPGTT